MSSSNDLQELSIATLFNPAERYVIPIYQRNFAWGATEVEQLIQDVYDAAKRNHTSENNGQGNIDYYIGSLVVHLRDNGSYETIDGQQRHTTLSILLALLKNEQQLGFDETSDFAINLHFDSRPKSARTLDDLYKNETSVEPEEPAIKAAYNIAARYLRKEGIDVDVFSQYLLNHVKILRVKVPKGTDLNHYFEIMNNRGEQLEKHEVLKARLMVKYKDDTAAQTCFSAIWDACADMHRYVQLGFSVKVRNEIFGVKWSMCPTSFGAIKSCFTQSTNNSTGRTLGQIINNRKYGANDHVNYEETVKDERFNAVIDFPNFLLQVLRVNTKQPIPLDDKRLLDVFEAKDTEIDPSIFIMQLLKCRMLFDRYIIKRDNDEKWSLLSLEPYEKSFSYINSIGKDEDDSVNSQLIMILSMFHVSYPAMVYKHWLSGALKALLELSLSDELNVAGDKYLEALEHLSDDFFYSICGVGANQDYYDVVFHSGCNSVNREVDESLLHIGTGVQNFVFNRLDYLLWQKLRSGYQFVAVDLGYIKERYNVFQFSFRTSVEHYFPQTNPWGKAPMDKVDRFGNLCLISPSSNSKLSNYSPTDKKQYYAEKGRTESLKQAFMMSYSQWSPDGVGLANIETHETMMIDVLRKR
tara:strand:- start:5850 stop:7766 length:1917 start_codon:yes stop_codon:yes gene_type:complete